MGKEGIPTEYRHYRFRSRLEAIWARFFDALEWPWKYEPFDFNGYIPDFVLLFPQPVLIEVKPELTLDALKVHTHAIDKSSWKGEALLLGVGLIDTGKQYLTLGLHRTNDYRPTEQPSEPGVWEPANLHWCRTKNHAGFHAEYGSWCCRRGCGEDHHNFQSSPSTSDHSDWFDKQWVLAQNLVQWAPRLSGVDS